MIGVKNQMKCVKNYLNRKNNKNYKKKRFTFNLLK